MSVAHATRGPCVSVPFLGGGLPTERALIFLFLPFVFFGGPFLELLFFWERGELSEGSSNYLSSFFHCFCCFFFWGGGQSIALKLAVEDEFLGGGPFDRHPQEPRRTGGHAAGRVHEHLCGRLLAGSHPNKKPVDASCLWGVITFIASRILSCCSQQVNLLFLGPLGNRESCFGGSRQLPESCRAGKMGANGMAVAQKKRITWDQTR